MRFLDRIQRWYRMRKHLRDVGPLLVRRYGESQYYPRGQIERSVRDAGLSKSAVMTAYALYMNEKEFVAAFGEGALRDLSAERAVVADLYFAGNTDYSAADVTSLVESSTWGGDSGGSVAQNDGDAAVE